MIASNRIRRHMRGWKPFPHPETRRPNPQKRWKPIVVLIIETIVLVAVVGLFIILGGTDSTSVEE